MKLRQLHKINFLKRTERSLSDAHEVFRGASAALFIRGLGATLSFLFNLVIAQLLGAAGTGLFFLALSFTVIGSLFSRVGLDNILLRLVAHAYAANDGNRAKAVVRAGLSIAAVSSPLIAASGFLLATQIAIHVYDKPELAVSLRWASLAIIATTFQILLSQVLRGARSIVYSSLVAAALHPALGLLLIWPSIYFLGDSGAIAAYFFSTALAALSGCYIWRLMRGPKSLELEKQFRWRELVPGAKALFLMSLIQNWMIPWAPVSALGILYSSQETGVFAAATRVSSLLAFFLTSVNIAIAPKFAELHKLKQTERLKRLSRQFSLFSFFATLPFLVLLILYSEEIMHLFGSEFRSGAMTLSILSIGHMVNIATGSVGFILIMGGREDVARNTSVLSAVILLILLGILVPIWGATGAALASVAAISFANIINSFSVWRFFGFIVYPSYK
ncbi:oligosaccharide flippase family protein [Pelagibacterium lacus]|uniref:Polysaccharide biosynthesis protein C-terminal domain-containing protein n=1 Tax=Pelagibacterium lacus TaxID=2282655 RepID=A0A369VZ94_9HYPH|nr:oligosaccharide flippase family protein [Pelagibacterium lacus]RDE07638.1 hypothetical protein DVH29_15685 [Pelagibacterium lacus]